MLTRDVPAGSTTLSVTDTGEGTPIVLLHAFPLNARMWAPQLAALPAGWRAVAPDLRGFGRSPRGDAPATHVRNHAADVLGLIDALELGPVVVAGVSMGGYVAFECWRQRPAAIRGLVLADTRAEADSDEARARRTAMQATASRDGVDAVIEAMMPGLLGASTRTGDPHLAVEVRRWALESTPEGIVDALEALRTRPDSRPDLRAIRCPTLVVVGSEDTLTPPEVARVIADGIAGAAYVEIPRAGHLANIERPEAFNAAMAGFLTRIGN